MLQKYKESGLQEDLCFAEVKVVEDLKGLWTYPIQQHDLKSDLVNLKPILGNQDTKH